MPTRCARDVDDTGRAGHDGPQRLVRAKVARDDPNALLAESLDRRCRGVANDRDDVVTSSAQDPNDT